LPIIVEVVRMDSRGRTSSLIRWVAIVAVAAALAAFGVAARSQDAPQDAVTIAGTSVTLTPPAGFRVAGRALDNGAGSTISISERSAEGYQELAATFSSAKNLSAAYADQGVTIRAVRQISAPVGPVLFATGTQSFRGRNSIRYFALLKGDKAVLMAFNLADRGFSEADAEALVRSVSITPAPTLDEQLVELPFTFSVVEPFRVGSIRARNTVTLTTGDDDAPENSQPVVVIGRGQSQAVMGDEGRVAVELLKNTAGFREAAVTAQNATTFAGGAGYVVTAVVADRTVVQYLRIVPGGAYLRMVARGPTGAMQAAEPAITEIANSVEPK
jgi:hypothetical protein